MRRALGARREESYWACVHVLQERGTREVFDAAAELLSTESPKKRALGADVLAQLGSREEAFREERRDLLLDLIEREECDEVLGAALSALGGARAFDDPKGSGAVCRLADHPNADVRLGVVHALYAHSEPDAVEVLIRSSRDPDARVRDWSTFSLGQNEDLDSPEVRAALRARLDDEDDDTRAEALGGLVARHEPRMGERLLEEFRRGPPGTQVLEAAGACRDTRLLAPLLDLLRGSRDDPDVSGYWLGQLKTAIGAIQASRLGCASERFTIEEEVIEHTRSPGGPRPLEWVCRLIRAFVYDEPIGLVAKMWRRGWVRLLDESGKELTGSRCETIWREEDERAPVRVGASDRATTWLDQWPKRA